MLSSSEQLLVGEERNVTTLITAAKTTNQTNSKRSMLVCATTLTVRDFLHEDNVCYFLSLIRGQTLDLRTFSSALLFRQ